ncbi:MAG: T9SS type A sorting domain-containing protein [bacterium]
MLRNVMAKPIGIIVVVFTITRLLLAQGNLWQRIFDTGETDYAEDITTDYQGNIIVVGTTIPEEINPPNREDILIIKYNQVGDTLWIQTYDSTYVDEAYGVATDKQANIIVVGSIHNDMTNADIHIVKYDPNGNLIWTQTYTNGENVGEFGYGVATDSKNNIIVTGKAYYNWGDYIILKYDQNGNLLWMRTYDGAWEDYAQDVAVDGSDNIIVTGYSNRDMNWDWCTIKYSPEGDIIWIRRYDVAETDWAFGVATDQDDNVIVAGETHQLLPGTGGCSAMVIKYSAQGDTLWTKIFTDTLQYAEVGTFTDVTTDDQGNIYLAGEYFYWSDTGTSNNRSDYYIVKCDLYGDTLWTVTYDYDNEDEVSGIVLDNEGNIVVTGTTNHRYGWFEYDFLTIKLKNKAVDKIDKIHLFLHEFVLHQNYPNPFNLSTTFRYEIPEAAVVKITIYNVLGHKTGVLVNELKQPGIYETVWDASDVTNGLYFVQMVGGNFKATKKLILVK